MEPPKRADKEQLEKVFRKYASVERDGAWFMSPSDLVTGYLRLAGGGLSGGAGSDRLEAVLLLASLADTTGNKLISFSEFRSFECVLCTPDAVNRLAFNLFDCDKTGRIQFENFKRILSATSIHKNVPFDFSSSFVAQYFGKEKQYSLDYHEFLQLHQSLPTEHARQAFASRDTNKSGTIPALDFVDLMRKTRGFRMSKYVQENLLSVAGGSTSKQVSYAYFKAFNQFLGNLDILEKIVEGAVTRIKSAKVTEGLFFFANFQAFNNYFNTPSPPAHPHTLTAQLLQEAQQYAQVTPLQVSLLFSLCSLEERAAGSISLDDFKRLIPEHRRLTTPVSVQEPAASVGVEESSAVSPWKKALEPVYRFVLAGCGGEQS